MKFCEYGIYWPCADCFGLFASRWVTVYLLCRSSAAFTGPWPWPSTAVRALGQEPALACSEHICCALCKSNLPLHAPTHRTAKEAACHGLCRRYSKCYTQLFCIAQPLSRPEAFVIVAFGECLYASKGRRLVSAEVWQPSRHACSGPEHSAAAATERYLWSVTPCLMAWPAVCLEPGPASLVVGGTLAIAYGVHEARYPCTIMLHQVSAK